MEAINHLKILSKKREHERASAKLRENMRIMTLIEFIFDLHVRT